MSSSYKYIAHHTIPNQKSVSFAKLVCYGKIGQKNQRQQALELKRIEDENHRTITFSKRKFGICKNASELTILTSAKTMRKRRGKIMKEIIKGKTSQGWWDSPIDDLNVEQLRQLDADFES
ncbi:hypothetical protein Dsin_000080 [Dipteronia sinensis]|uniref:MADS-box domain-containing protein n=1 Tax=Dipteronia sinensis TaxID=43782 RepID=A0AAD9ZJI8_9ROSI|nr:hypothetical protein Dsin_000080 [Dipteronia sinensis]